MNRTKVFYAGQQPDYNYSNDDVKAIAEGYTETAYSAPWVAGHEAKSGDPAMGWVRGLEYAEEEGLGVLYANTDFNEAGQALIDSGKYENKSVSFYTPESVFNPTPGQWALRHVAMLGAEPPVLKNLGPIAVIDYSEDDTAFVSYSCGCQGATTLEIPMRNIKKEYAELEQKMLVLKAEMEEPDSELESTVEAIIETVLEESEDMTELEQIKAERDQLLAQLNASKEANTALSVSAAVSPYYSEGVLTEDILSESALTNVLTKLTLGTTNYAEEETPIIVIEKLLAALIGNKPPEPEYSENTEVIDLPSETVSYSDGDELHALSVKTAKSYGLSYGQALSAVVMAQETSVSGKVNFSECLADAVKGFKI
jgi:hypothetical protein